MTATRAAASHRTVTADRGDAGTRLDLVIRRHLADLDQATRTRVQAWIENGRVTVNGFPVRRVSTRTALGDVVVVAVDPAAPRRAMAPENTPLGILFEDEHLLAVDKPAGVVVHPAYRNAEGTLMNALLWHAREWPAPMRPSLVHRLDKLTSGLVIVAKRTTVHAALQRAIESGRARKDYLALVYGPVNRARGEIALRLARDPDDRRKVIASSEVGAASLTRFTRLSRADGLALLRCRLETGRMHQLRVHLAARGWPIVGDPVYGDARWSRVADPAIAAALRAFPRQALHAWRVSLVHPITNEPLLLEASVPEDLRNLVAACGLRAASA
jgi:23S rRNA pseudouridine1911/1915/1917 synthase